MCQPGNQTINKGCWDALLKVTGRKSLSNKDARQLLRQAGGCLVNTKYLTPTDRRANVGTEIST